MAKIGVVQNGLKKASNGHKRKSNPLTLARVKGFAKKNGLKVLPKTANGIVKKAAVANPKRKKRRGGKRRNGLTASFGLTRRNGLFGNTKSDVKNVGALLGGMVGGKALARVLQSFVAPYLASTGLGKYAEILSDGAVALLIAPMVARKIAGQSAADMARLGGLANVAVDVIEMIAPNTLSGFLSGNLLTGGQAVLTPSQVANIVAATDASPQDKAKIAGAMYAIESGQPIQQANTPYAGLMFD
jgi:hypothetical protein